MKQAIIKISGILLTGCLLCLTGGMPTAAAADSASDKPPRAAADDTMLMFVGMELDVLSIASRREESASQAPAIARVIRREEIERSGYSTLSELLDMTPGFYMAPREWGSLPYLRGMKNSALFLYDTVPMHSNINKTVHPLDHELSLAPVKRVEIVRGPGSVLWGPDAYGGIVNIVSLEGRDVNGAQTGLLYNSRGDQAGGWVNAGSGKGPWDFFFSASGRYGKEDEREVNIVEFWNGGDTPAPPAERYGRERPDQARYIDVSARLRRGDRFTLSGRFSDFEKPYTVSAEGARVWQETRSTPFSFIKAESKTDLNANSAVRLMGYYSSVESTYEVIDKSYSPSESTAYGEIIYDRRFFSGSGLLTGGVSFRDRRVEDAPVWDSYLPAYLGSENLDFLPEVKQTDYENDLVSVFGQYTHKIGTVDLFLGGRFDDHDAYPDNFSYNLGIVWPFHPDWQLKMLYGTAYRTPFARQLSERTKPDPEEINTFNAQLTWQASPKLKVKTCAFISRISDHVVQDAYAGLSRPNHQTLRGIEIGGELRPADEWRLSANLTALDNSGPDDSYNYLAYSYIRPDGSIENVYENIRSPFDMGPDLYGNVLLEWRPLQKLSLFGRLNYAAGHKLAFLRGGESTVEGEDLYKLDITGLWRDIAGRRTDLSVSVRNVLDRKADLPGTYEMIETDGAAVEILLKKSWK